MIEKDRYALFEKEEIRRDFTNVSLYYVKQNNRIKKCGPVDIEGVRYKLDYLTGEVRPYTRAEYQQNAYCSIEYSRKLLGLLLDVNDFDWFCTLTFDNEKIHRHNDEDVYKAYVRFIDNVKHQFPTLRYITVIERHDDEEKTIHFHMVIGGVPWQKLGLVNSGKVCCHWATKKKGICSQKYFNHTKHLHILKDTDGLAVYNITSFIYGFTTATRIVSRERCNSYIKKYIDKALGSTDAFKKRFYYSSNLNVPNIVRRCVGADFEAPDSDYLKAYMHSNVLFKSSDSSRYFDNYNIGVCKIDNSLKLNIENGLLPTGEATSFD